MDCGLFTESDTGIWRQIRVDHLAVGADGADEQAVTAALTEFGQVRQLVFFVHLVKMMVTPTGATGSSGCDANGRIGWNAWPTWVISAPANVCMAVARIAD